MQDELVFRPDSRMGSIIQLVLIGLLVVAGLIGLRLTSQASLGLSFALVLLLPLATTIFVPILVYRVYALQTAVYTLERNGVHLRWGLRLEDIPIDEVRWVSPLNELTPAIPLPTLRLPGDLSGKRNIAGAGTIEYFATTKKKLLFIATENGGFVISPANPEAFQQAYERFIEMGSLTPLAPRSLYPALIFAQVWSSRLARGMLFAGFVLNLGLLGWVLLVIPGRSTMHLGFRPNLMPGDLVPANRLLLLPFLNLGFLFINFLLGLFFFRRIESQPASFLLWSTSILTSLLFMVAVFLFFKTAEFTENLKSVSRTNWHPVPILFQRGQTNMQLAIGIVLAIIIALLAYKANSLDKSGAIAAIISGGLIFGLGGLPWAALLVTFFITSSILSKLFLKRKSAFTEKFSKGSQRDWGQVMANSGVGALLVVIHALRPGEVWPWIAYAGAMATVNADTWATELGVLSPTLPRLVTNGRRVEQGTSGGVSLMGSLSALAAAALVAAIAAFFQPQNNPAGLIIAASAGGLLGSFFDSLLGATVQAIYWCPACMKETERHPLHICGTATTLLRGWSWLNNDWVNFWSSAAGALVCVIIWLVF